MTINVKELGLISRFNGVDVTQTQHYIKLSNAIYIDKILKNHPWIFKEHPPAMFPLLIRSDNEYLHKIETAKPLTEEQHLQYESDIGFSYQQGVGEVIYALVTCRPDILFAAIKLTQYSTTPS